MKKFLSLLLAVLVAFSSISMAVPATTAAEDTDPVITVDTVVAQPGDTVAVNLTIKNNPGILGMTLKVTYDESKVTLTGVVNGSTLSYMTFTTPKNLSSGCQLPWDAMDVPADQVKDGVIATLTFQVSEKAADNEEIEIGVSYDAGAIIDNDMAALTIGMVNGQIRIGNNSGGSTGDSPESPTENPDDSEGDSTSNSVITAETVTAKPGEEVDVQLTIKNNPGILGMTLKVTYDESKVTLIGVANGSTLSYMTFTTPKNLSSGCQLPWDAIDVPADQVKDGVIATLTFQVPENAAENEEIEIGVSYDAGAIIDNDMAALSIGMVNGKIVVESEQEDVVLTGSIRARTATLNLLDKVSVVYKCSDDTIVTNNAEVMERGILLFASAELAATKDPSKAYETIILEYSAAEDRYIGQSEGIDARDMDKSQFAVAYLKMIDGTYIFGTKGGVDQVVEYSPLIYCTKNKDNAQVGALCRAMMHYGAAAQVAQYGKTTGLMNEGLAEIPFDESVLGESVFSANTEVTNGLKLRSVTMDLKGAISYVVKFTVEDSDVANKQLYAEYTLLGETKVVELEEGSDGLLWATISGVPAKDLGATLRVKAYYLNDNGERMYSGELVYSGYEYVRRALTNVSYTENIKNLAKALAMYISYADAYGN